MDIVTVYLTCRDAAQAQQLARTLVAERLAACANVLPHIQSVYHWEGRLCEDAEAAVLLKTRAALVPALTTRIKELHSYEVPCVVAWPIVGGNPAYLAWVAQETAGVAGKARKERSRKAAKPRRKTGKSNT